MFNKTKYGETWGEVFRILLLDPINDLRPTVDRI